MRLKVIKINDLGKSHEEPVIANNANEAEISIDSLNPNSKRIDTKLVYK